MKGRRVQPDENGWFNGDLAPGDYVLVNPLRMADGSPLRADIDWSKHYPMWLGCAPNGHSCNLHGHKVVEHEDCTITVSPSILITTSRDQGKTNVELFHGYLERGVWRDA